MSNSTLGRTRRPYTRRLGVFLYVLLAAMFLGGAAHAASGKRTAYKVKDGDNLWDISLKTGVEVSELKKLNKLKGNSVKPGQVLKVRATADSDDSDEATSSSRKSRPSSKAQSSDRAKHSKDEADETPRARSKHKSNTDDVVHTVKKGENLAKIAKRHGTTVAKLRKLNKKSTLARLKPGSTLVVGRDVDDGASGRGGSRIVEPTQLPESGPGFVAPRRDRVWGTPTTIAGIQAACADVARRYPGTKPVFVGDVSFRHGGKMRPHRSHRLGRDVDMSYFMRENPNMKQFHHVDVGSLDVEKTWSLIEALLDTGDVEVMYVDYRIQKLLYQEARSRGLKKEALERLFEYPGPKGGSKFALIQHERGHDDHIHVRFKPEPGEKKS